MSITKVWAHNKALQLTSNTPLRFVLLSTEL